MIDHKDGDESNGDPANLRWLCKSCNTRLGLSNVRAGQGVRTRQYNPANPGARTLAEYTEAAMQHTRGAHDAGGEIIHETPKEKRQEFGDDAERVEPIADVKTGKEEKRGETVARPNLLKLSKCRRGTGHLPARLRTLGRTAAGAVLVL